MKVLVDGTSLDLKEGASLGDALSQAGTKPAVGAIVGIVKGRGEKSLQTNSYWLNTTKGRIRIELLDLLQPQYPGKEILMSITDGRLL